MSSHRGFPRRPGPAAFTYVRIEPKWTFSRCARRTCARAKWSEWRQTGHDAWWKRRATASSWLNQNARPNHASAYSVAPRTRVCPAWDWDELPDVELATSPPHVTRRRERGDRPRDRLATRTHRPLRDCRQAQREGSATPPFRPSSPIRRASPRRPTPAEPRRTMPPQRAPNTWASSIGGVVVICKVQHSSLPEPPRFNVAAWGTVP